MLPVWGSQSVGDLVQKRLLGKIQQRQLKKGVVRTGGDNSRLHYCAHLQWKRVGRSRFLPRAVCFDPE